VNGATLLGETNRPRRLSGFLCVGAIWIVLGIVGLVSEVLDRPPDFSALRVVSGPLTTFVTVRKHSKGSDDVTVHLKGLDARIDDFCFLWRDCTLPENIALLGGGDPVELRIYNRSVWQFAHGSEILLSYSQKVAAHRWARRRGLEIFGAVATVGLAMLAVWAYCVKSRGF